MKRVNRNHRGIGIFLMVALLAWCFPGQLFAGSKPSVETCNAMGVIDAKCVVCSTGEYLGKVSVDAKYSSEHNNCSANIGTAKQRCRTIYGADSGTVGAELKYTIGTTNYTSTSPGPSNCSY